MILGDYDELNNQLKYLGASFLESSSCAFRINRPCNEFFHEIMTMGGLCYTFNGLDGSVVYRTEK